MNNKNLKDLIEKNIVKNEANVFGENASLTTLYVVKAKSIPNLCPNIEHPLYWECPSEMAPVFSYAFGLFKLVYAPVFMYLVLEKLVSDEDRGLLPWAKALRR